MRNALLEFGRGARDANIAVVFFAGHGIEVNGADLADSQRMRSCGADTDVDNEAIWLRSVLNAVGSAHRLGQVDSPISAAIIRLCRSTSASRLSAPWSAASSRSSRPVARWSRLCGPRAARRRPDGFGWTARSRRRLLRYLEMPGLEIGYLFRIVRDDVLLATNRHQEPFIYRLAVPAEEIYLEGAADSRHRHYKPRWAGLGSSSRTPPMSA